MEAQLIEKQPVNATFKVTVDPGEVDQTFDRVLTALARQVRVPGFRPGRAPRGVLERRVGREALQEEVREALVDANYPKAVQELELTPIHAHFHSDPPTEGQAFTFEVHAELYPEVTLPDVSDIVIDASGRDLTDDMVHEAVEQLRRQHATRVPVERAAEGTDIVLIQRLPDADADAGSAGEPAAAAGDEAGEHGEDDEDDEAAPTGSLTPVDMEEASEEVREQLFGKGIGDIFDLRLVDEVLTAEEAEAAGQDPTEVEPHTHVMRMLVKDVQAKEKPDTDDEFAKTLGFETWAEAEAQVRASIARQLADEAFEAQRDELVDKLIEGATFDVPAILVQRRKSGLLEDLGVDLRRQGMTVERYLAMLDARGTREDFEKELDASALRGVKRDLVLERLLEQRGTEVSDEEFGEAVRHLAARRRLDLPRFRREMGEEWLRNYRFLLARDKALRETLEGLTGTAGESAAEAAVEVPAGHAEGETPAAGAVPDEEAGATTGEGD